MKKPNYLMLLILLLIQAPAMAWITTMTGDAAKAFDETNRVALDHEGNVIAVGTTDNASTGRDFTVAKLDGKSGKVLWRRAVSGSDPRGFAAAQAVAVDSADNVIAAGCLENRDTGRDFTVIKYSSRGEEQWRQVVNGTANRDDEARALAIDSADQVIAAGWLANTRTGRDFTVIKYSGRGEEQWRRVINGTANRDDEARALAIDSADQVIAAGVLVNTGTGPDFTVIKYSSRGEEQWRRMVDGTASRDDEARALAIDSADQVIAAGWLENTGTGRDFTVIKYSSRGEEQWRRVVDGTAPFSYDAAQAVAIDSAENVIAAGWLENTGTGRDFTVIKYSSQGEEQWRRVVNGTALFSDDQARSVALDSADNVMVAGWLENASTGRDFTVIKYSPRGEEQWRRVVNGTASRDDEARTLAIDSADNIIAAGVLVNTGTGRDFTVIGFAAITGAELWHEETNGSAPRSFDSGNQAVVDKQDNIVVVGSTDNLATGIHFTTAKLDKKDGKVLWRRVVSGSDPHGFDEAVAVAIDSAENVIAAGWLENTGTGRDFTVIKYSSQGEEQWRRVVNGTAPMSSDEARAVAIDSADNVIVAGWLQNRGTGRDFTVIKYSRQGEEQWRRVVNGTANGFDEARALAIDSADNVIAAGVLVNTGTGANFAVIKFSSQGEEQWRRVANGNANASAVALAVAIDSADQVVAAGWLLNTGTGRDFTVIKYSRRGEEQWRRVINGPPAYSEDSAQAVAIDSADHVIVAGYLEHPGTMEDFVVIKFSGQGEEQWRQVVNGTADMDDQARAVAIDSADNVIAVGVVENAGTGRDFTVIKYNSRGQEQWRRVVDGTAPASDDEARAVAIDSADNVISAGVTEDIDTSADITVMKLHPDQRK